MFCVLKPDLSDSDSPNHTLLQVSQGSVGLHEGRVVFFFTGFPESEFLFLLMTFYSKETRFNEGEHNNSKGIHYKSSVSLTNILLSPGYS